MQLQARFHGLGVSAREWLGGIRTWGTSATPGVLTLTERAGSVQLESSHTMSESGRLNRTGRRRASYVSQATAARQVTDRLHLVQKLRETIERELALHRTYLRVRVTANGLPNDPPLAPVVDLPVCAPFARERQPPPARRLATQTEIGRQLRQTHQTLLIDSRGCRRRDCLSAGLRTN
jgi:hypothetical protein